LSINIIFTEASEPSRVGLATQTPFHYLEGTIFKSRNTLCKGIGFLQKLSLLSSRPSFLFVLDLNELNFHKLISCFLPLQVNQERPNNAKSGLLGKITATALLNS
jgi:hypothetical protein